MAFYPEGSSTTNHVVLFPFMAKGHTIPILHLARLLHHRQITVTVFSTPANSSFISNSLPSTTNITIISLPFLEKIDGVPSGIESTDKLPSLSLFIPFANATKQLQPHLEQALHSLPKVTFMVSDGFLPWTLDSASKFDIPLLVFYGASNHAVTLQCVVRKNRLHLQTESEDEPFIITDFPWIKLTRNDLGPNFGKTEGPSSEFSAEIVRTRLGSYGILTNSFYELEPLFFDYWNRNFKPKSWCVGPVCLAEPIQEEGQAYKKPTWVQWLDQKLEQGRSVLYVAFGSQAEIPAEQLEEIKLGLEASGVNFLWVARGNQDELSDGFAERVKDRGTVVREWVNQREILSHKSVRGFLSHCGWNSVLESICAKVPILAWPMMAEQHLNARMVVEEIKVALRVETSNGSVRGFVKKEGLEKMVRELMEGAMGKEVRKKVEEYGKAALKAMEEGGSSWQALDQLIDEIQALKTS